MFPLLFKNKFLKKNLFICGCALGLHCCLHFSLVVVSGATLSSCNEQALHCSASLVEEEQPLGAWTLEAATPTGL